MLRVHTEGASVSLAPVAGAMDFCDRDSAADRMWCVVSVYPRHEKHVAELCRIRGVRYILPLYSSLRRWKDRRKQLEMVLFPGYVFVNVTLRDRFGVLTLPGVARFVTFQGQPAVVPDREIEGLGKGVRSGLLLQPHPYLQKGRPVRVRSGPMAGVEGILVRKRDRFRVVLSIDLIMRSVAVEVDEADIEPLI